MHLLVHLRGQLWPPRRLCLLLPPLPPRLLAVVLPLLPGRLVLGGLLLSPRRLQRLAGRLSPLAFICECQEPALPLLRASPYRAIACRQDGADGVSVLLPRGRLGVAAIRQARGQTRCCHRLRRSPRRRWCRLRRQHPHSPPLAVPRPFCHAQPAQHSVYCVVQCAPGARPLSPRSRRRCQHRHVPLSAVPRSCRRAQRAHVAYVEQCALCALPRSSPVPPPAATSKVHIIHTIIHKWRLIIGILL